VSQICKTSLISTRKWKIVLFVHPHQVLGLASTILTQVILTPRQRLKFRFKYVIYIWGLYNYLNTTCWFADQPNETKSSGSISTRQSGAACSRSRKALHKHVECSRRPSIFIIIRGRVEKGSGSEKHICANHELHWAQQAALILPIMNVCFRLTRISWHGYIGRIDSMEEMREVKA